MNENRPSATLHSEHPMDLAIFGATGGTGRRLVEQALAAGHRAVVLVRTPASLAVQHDRLRVVQGDVRDAAQVASVVVGQDAVLSALGPTGRGPVTVCTEATVAILAAMGSHGVRRLIALSAYGARDSHDRTLYNRLLWLMQKEKMLDKDRMEDLIVRSAVDWTLIRPPFLTNGPRTGRYHTGTDVRMTVRSHISRADVADFMLAQLAQTTYLRQAPALVA